MCSRGAETELPTRPRARRRLWRTLSPWLVLMFYGWSAIGSRADDARQVDIIKQVLIVHSNQSVLPATVLVDNAIRKEIQSGSSARLDVFSEFLDKDRFPEPEAESRMAKFLREKYAKRPIDLIVATGAPALRFLMQQRRSLFSTTPVLHVAVSQDELDAIERPSDVVGVVSDLDPVPTIGLALSLQPNARHAVIVDGTTQESRTWEAAARRELLVYEGRLDFRYLSGLPMPELLHEVGQLPPDTFVLYYSILTDGAGRSFIPRDVAEKLSESASVPVYGLFETFLDHGIVGGSMASFEAMGRQVGQLGRKVLAGQGSETPPHNQLARSEISVDWRQLQRWRLSESRLPPGSIVRFREATLWGQYRWQVIAAVGLLVTQSVLITALVVQGGRRRRAEDEARDSEERMSLAAELASLGFWHWDITANWVWAGEHCRGLVGLEQQVGITLEGFLAALHRDDLEPTKRSLEHAGMTGKPYRADWRMSLADGSERWIRAIGRTKSDDSGQPARVMGVVIDVTQEKQAEAELAHWRSELIHLTRVALLGELSGALAHELNQPLSAIVSNSQAALMYLGQGNCDLSEVRTILADIVADGKRASNVIKHLHTLFTKSEAQVEPFDLNDAVSDTLKLTHGDLLARKVRVTATLTPRLPVVLGDRVQLQQVLLNLIINACDAMAQNEPAEREIIIVTEQQSCGTAQFWVSDRGGGIVAAVEDKLFQPFVTSKARGLGLGLSLCRTIIAAHGGSLSAVNNPDRGATFHVSLPASGGVLQ